MCADDTETEREGAMKISEKDRDKVMSSKQNGTCDLYSIIKQDLEKSF